jgi:hypothetical protein
MNELLFTVFPFLHKTNERIIFPQENSPQVKNCRLFNENSKTMHKHANKTENSFQVFVAPMRMAGFSLEQ